MRNCQHIVKSLLDRIKQMVCLTHRLYIGQMQGRQSSPYCRTDSGSGFLLSFFYKQRALCTKHNIQICEVRAEKLLQRQFHDICHHVNHVSQAPTKRNISQLLLSIAEKNTINNQCKGSITNSRYHFQGQKSFFDLNWQLRGRFPSKSSAELIFDTFGEI